MIPQSSECLPPYPDGVFAVQNFQVMEKCNKKNFQKLLKDRHCDLKFAKVLLLSIAGQSHEL